ncbi:DHA2 family efflux MFS transporter permease subunit [Planosporangium thailandense]|uniref:DHA2 family efflux MFS transporter permease subunit n=1 Tax=Planosporangium thailandense TaxID=765197 RepID=A0ABX0Y008_9ACTN|nr:DHA2 family efflux MFS transporter permease subunit [Planosporangium thailandense]NJC71672.1 DHA2 family efflux MFS transporter permease subunit [Planosporangium thailandense]
MTTPQPGAAASPPSGTGAPTADSKPSHSPWLVLFVLCLGFFMILLDTTIVNIAIPNMIDRLHASLDQILWVLNAYILVYAVLLITAGRLGDLYGPKQLFMAGLLIFTLASAACGIAHNPGQLIAARVAQGLGGALLTPQTLSVLTVIFPPQKRGAAFGIWGAVAGVATIAGPTLGGFIVTHWGWSWIFFVNVPIGVLALALAAAVMPNLKLNRRHRLDLPGTVLATVGLFLVTYGLIEGQPHDWGKVWGSITITEVIVAGIVVLALFMIQQYRQRDGEPLVPMAIFRDRNFSVMNFVGATLGFGMLGLFLPIVIFLQSVLGLSALQAGLTTAPMSVVSMVVAPFAGRMADRIGGKFILMAGLALFAVGTGLMTAAAHPDMNRWHLLPGLLVSGLGMGLTFAPLQTVAMRNIEPRMAGAASGLINTTRQLGSVIGSAAAGALLQNQLATKLSASAKAHASALPPQFRDRFVAGFSHASGGSLEVGAGQNGVNFGGQVPDAVRKIIVDTFHEGYTNAMRVSLILPFAVLALASLSCLLVKRRSRSGQADTPAGAGAPERVGA